MEKIIAAIRIRPSDETDPEKIGVLKSGDKDVIAKRHSDKFSFESVYDQQTTNMDIFQGTVQPLLERAIKGYNVCIFTYGQTSSGKTFTMKGTAKTPGVIPLTLNYLFEQFKVERTNRMSATGEEDRQNSSVLNNRFKSVCKSSVKKIREIQRNVSLEYIEIYNETINDLLKHNNQDLKLRMKPDKSLFIEGLNESQVESFEEALDLL